jgi:hypothetical protein
MTADRVESILTELKQLTSSESPLEHYEQPEFATVWTLAINHTGLTKFVAWRTECCQ